MFNFFKKKKRSQGMNAVVLSHEGIGFASIIRTPGQPPVLTSVSFSTIDNPSETQSVFKQLVQDQKLKDKSITTSLLLNESHLTMIEKPQVADDELRQAVRWGIKESIPFNLDDAIVDVFEIPGQKERGRTPLVYVTAAEKSFLKQKIQLMEQQELEVESIDIAELVMRNIASLLAEDQQGVALLNLDATKGLMTLTHESSLYLARNIDVGYSSLIAASSILGDVLSEDGLSLEQGFTPDQQRALDEIVLEVQRSLDYYESHFAKPAINSLVIAPLPQAIPGMINYLASALGLQVRLLDLNLLLDSTIPMSEELQSQSFLAIGAALRENEIKTNKTQGDAA
ncbi:MAG: pilus assembly protein PilM [Woeseiaceae bacterium]